MADDAPTSSEDDLTPAGPDNDQRFNSARIVVTAVVVIVASSIYLSRNLHAGTSSLIPLLGVIAGSVGLVFALWYARRFWIKRNGVTIDEADPRRTPEQQRRRDDRVRKSKVDMTPRQELLAGVVLVPIGIAWPFVSGLIEGKTDGGDYFFGFGIAALGLFLLIHAAVVRLRRGR